MKSHVLATGIDADKPAVAIPKQRKLTLRKRQRMSRETLYSLLAIAPAFVLFVLFTYYPLANSLFYAFTDWSGYGSFFHFVGFANFRAIFQDPNNVQAFSNTLYLAIGNLLIGLPLQLLLAVLLSQRMRGSNIFKALLYIPALLSPVVVSYTWIGLLQYTGVINSLAQAIGFKTFAVDWLGSVNLAKPSLILVNQWEFTGFGMVILLAGINSIPSEISEAARIDGAVGFRRFWYVTLPLMMPAITINLFLGITGALKIFELPYLLTNGGPIGSSTTVVMSIYNYAFGYDRFGAASSIGIAFFVFIAVITIAQLYFTRRREVEF